MVSPGSKGSNANCAKASSSSCLSSQENANTFQKKNTGRDQQGVKAASMIGSSIDTAAAAMTEYDEAGNGHLQNSDMPALARLVESEVLDPIIREKLETQQRRHDVIANIEQKIQGYSKIQNCKQVTSQSSKGSLDMGVMADKSEDVRQNYSKATHQLSGKPDTKFEESPRESARTEFQLPPTTTLSRSSHVGGTGGGLPGAYATVPEMTHQPEGSNSSNEPQPQTSSTGQSHGIIDSDNNRRHHHLLEARRVVEEDDESPSSTTLPGQAAVEVDPEELERRRQVSKQNAKRNTMIYLVAMVMVGVVCASTLVTVLVIFLAKDKQPSTKDKNGGNLSGGPASETNETMNDNSNSPAVVILENLPEYTMESLQDPFSPQSEAYHWLSQHQHLNELPQWRRRQLFALATIYYSFGGPDWPFGLNEDWLDDSRSECDWYSGLYGYFSLADGVTYGERVDGEEGFTCNERGEFHTIRIALGADFGFSIDGAAFPPEISWLTALQYIGMAHNGLSNFSAPTMFPPQFYHLTNLEYLSLRDNLMSKPIPSELGKLTKLKRLYLWNVNATGTVPTELGLLTDMERIDLSRNSLTGTIPTELVWSDRISLSNNSLTGTIPTEIERLTSVYGIHMEWNQLSGTIPSGIGGLGWESMGYFRIVGNTNLEGTVPEQFCSLATDDTCTYAVDGEEKPCGFSFTCSEQLCGCDWCACGRGGGYNHSST